MKNFEILANNILFKDIDEADIEKVLKCLNARVVKYKKDNIIYNIGDKIESVGIVLIGNIHIVKYDLLGNSHIIQNIGTGGLFADSYACQKIPSLVNVLASAESEILFINANKILEVCSLCCKFHQKLIKNLFCIITQKNLNLIKKIECITPKTIRERILVYLNFEAQNCKQSSFNIPFNRQQLADYLLVDRSALSKELSKMQKDGLIEYKKNYFAIKHTHLT